jgi:hypothetical protein
LGRFGFSHTWDSAEFFDPALCKSGHIPESIEDIHPDLHRGRPVTTNSKENGQELGIGERLWALSQQSFARPFCFRPLRDALPSFLAGHSSSPHKKMTL